MGSVCCWELLPLPLAWKNLENNIETHDASRLEPLLSCASRQPVWTFWTVRPCSHWECCRRARWQEARDIENTDYLWLIFSWFGPVNMTVLKLQLGNFLVFTSGVIATVDYTNLGIYGHYQRHAVLKMKQSCSSSAMNMLRSEASTMVTIAVIQQWQWLCHQSNKWDRAGRFLVWI